MPPLSICVNPARRRYQCFADQKEFEQQVQRKQPHKIDIGAVFTLPPKVRAQQWGRQHGQKYIEGVSGTHTRNDFLDR